jgi:hypothetical protein
MIQRLPNSLVITALRAYVLKGSTPFNSNYIFFVNMKDLDIFFGRFILKIMIKYFILNTKFIFVSTIGFWIISYDNHYSEISQDFILSIIMS